MPGLRLVATILSFICITLNVSSQAQVLSFSEQEYYLFSYNKNPKPFEYNTNHIIEIISDGSQKAIEKTSYKYFFTIDIQVQLMRNNQRECFISFRGPVISGDVKYRGFSIADVLIPSNADITINVFDDADTRLKSYDMEGVKVTEEIDKNSLLIPDSTLPYRIKIKPIINSIYFSNKGKAEFDKRINNINIYYGSDSIIKQISDKLNKVDTDNIDLIPLYKIWIGEIEEETEKLEDLKLTRILSLDLYDPIRFKPRFDSLVMRLNDLQERFKNDFDQIELVYYDEAVEFIKSYRFDEAWEYLEKSLKFNTGYFPSLFMKSKLYLRNDEPDQAVGIVQKIYSEVVIDNSQKNMMADLSGEIIDYYIEKAKKQISQENNNEALESLTKAKDFCNEVAKIDPPQEIGNLTATAKYGIYKSFIQIAYKALDIESYDFAEIYIKKASDYQKNNQESIKTDPEINEFYNKLMVQCTQKGFSALSIPDFNAAQNYFDRAYRLCNAIDELTCSERLINGINAANQGIAMEYDAKIEEENSGRDNRLNDIKDNRKLESDEEALKREEKYNLSDLTRLISEGEILVEARHLEDAFIKFSKAKDLEKEFNLRSNPQLDEYIRISAKDMLIKKIKKTGFIVWKNDLDSAQNLIDKIIKDQNKYKLSSDQDINKSIAKLKDEIQRQKCFNAESEYKNKCLKAMREIRRAKFNDAKETIENARRIKNCNTQCDITDNCDERISSQYKNHFIYQTNLNQARKNVRDKNYSDAIMSYQNALNIFSSHQMDTLGIKPYSLSDFILGYKNVEFTIVALDYCINNNQLKDALILLRALRFMNVAAKETKNQQIELAKELTGKNYKNTAVTVPSEYINLEDKWFKYFRKEYFKDTSHSP